ncbi:hypothetical protein H7K05_10380 [Priestia aryabhattai]|uniref:hypothetical protein n=1 Tax=Priestia aryabhattai TaxID=412384 RepID=UPI001C8D7232|nr:hypothetical protein [Priestia aryabhattai]MBY0005731.1 hypothetical protein [Priestia aryabhattai]MBY0047588.1 hypothetical protein [Priestia aryabhattai]
MPLFPATISNEQVIRIIESNEFNDFHLFIKKELDIEDMNYQVLCKDYAVDNEGYEDSNVIARAVFSNEWSKLESVTFFTNNIAECINKSFFRISNEQVFEEIVNICIKYYLIHELVHVLQFKRGDITKEKMDRYMEIPYEERSIEIEADLTAVKKMSNHGDFEARIVELIKVRKSIDNHAALGLINLYKKHKF